METVQAEITFVEFLHPVNPHPQMAGAKTLSLNNSKYPGLKLLLDPLGVVVDYKGSLYLIPISNVTGIKFKKSDVAEEHVDGRTA
jgi:hypothetical protein